MLNRVILVDAGILPTCPKTERSRFPDHADFRIEIPSIEGPKPLEELLEASAAYEVTVNRVAQGSGGMLLKASEIRAMAEMGSEAGLEVSLFAGPRAGLDTGAFAHSTEGSSHYAAIRGGRQMLQAVQDVERSAEEGIRSFLVGDLGLLKTLSGLRARGDLPPDCIWKVSAYFPAANPVTVSVLQDLGAGTINVPSDIDVPGLAELRSAVSVPLDLYVESPESMGGTIRIMELDDLISAGAPLHIKFGLHNSQTRAYPSGLHVIDETARMARAKVHRASVALEWLSRSQTGFVQSKPHADGVAVPQP